MEPKEAAEYVLIWGQHFTQYRYQKANEAAILRGSAMKTLMQFKRFQIQTLGMANSLLINSRGGNVIEGLPKGAFPRFMVLNTVLGGARGSLVGAAYFLASAGAMGVFGALKNAIDPDNVHGLPNSFSSQEEAMEWLSTKIDTNIAEAIMFGAGSIAGLDTSGNFSLTNIGGDGLLGYIFGPTFGMIKDLFIVSQTEDYLDRPDLTRYTEVLLEGGAATRSVKNFAEWLMYMGQFDPELKPTQYTNSIVGMFGPQFRQAGTAQNLGYKSRWDAVAGILGFRSKKSTLAYMQHARWDAINEKYAKAKRKIASAYIQDQSRAEEMMTEWNLAYGHLGVYIYPSDLKQVLSSREDAVKVPIDERRMDRVYEPIRDLRRFGY